MTAAAIPEPGQARLVPAALGLVQGQTVPTAGPGGLRPGAGADTKEDAFSALFVALRPDIVAATRPAPADPVLPADGLPTMVLPGAVAIETTPLQLSTDKPARLQDGELLPADGSELPPPDVQTLLASLAAPAAAVPPPQPGPAPAMSPETELLPPGAHPARSAFTGTPATAAADSGQAETPAAALISGNDVFDSGVADEDADPVASTPRPAAEPTGNCVGPAGAEFFLGMDSRPRLDAMLNMAQRIIIGPEASPAATALPQGPGVSTTAAAASGAQPMTNALPFDSLPALEPLTNREAWAQGLGERLIVMAGRGMQSATLRLQPEHLGSIEVRIQVDEDGSAQVLFSAHQAPTREALENAIPRLRDLFSDQGLNLMQANVDSGRDGSAQRGFAVTSPAWKNWLTGNPELTAPAATSAWQLRPPGSRRIDVFV